jgi:NitT/TauT family transport system substrate-binding protein
MRSGIIMQALTAGEIDYTTLLSSSVRAAVAGLPVRVIMGLILKQTFFLLSQPEIRDVKQLKGKRIAVANFGSATDKSARMALERAGLDPNKDAIILALGDTGLRYAALQARTIEAAVLSPPYNFSAQRQGFTNLVWLGDLLGESPSNGLTTTLQKLKEQPDQVYRMLRATVRSMIYTREHPREVLPIMLKEFKGWDAESISPALDFIIKGMSRDGTFSESVLRDAINEEKARLNVKKEIPVSAVADFEPLNRVVREIGK